MGQGGVYVIRAAGCLYGDWSEWFDAQVIICESENTTTITAQLPDQAALYGLLVKVRDLGMDLLSVNRRIDP
jgi:hypothetical protein